MHVPHLAEDFSACTIAARNYLPQARVLAASLARHHPGAPFTLLLVDDEARLITDAHEPFRIWRLGDVGLSAREIGELGAYYDVTELSTAVKPLLLRALLQATDRTALYLDPDIKVFDRLDDAVRLAATRGIALTPHTTTPLPRDGRILDEFTVLGAGIYNLGMIGVGPSAAPFLDWWWTRTRRDAFVDPPRMRFTDQRWVDFVPALFDHAILGDPGYNVAYWNLHARQVSWTGSQYRVNDRPLRAFHFSGYDIARPHLLSRHQGDRPRILLSEHPGVARLCREYADDVRAATTTQAHGYGWERMANGMILDRRMRMLYREGVIEAESSGAATPPSPFDPGGPDAFLAWLREPASPDVPPLISRYLYRVRAERGDVTQAFGRLDENGARGYLDWVLQFGVHEERIPGVLLPPARRDRPTAAPKRDAGVNIVSSREANGTMGAIGGLVEDLARAAGLPTEMVSANAGYWSVDARYDVNLLAVNADQTPRVARRLGAEFFNGRPTAGICCWDLSWAPGDLAQAFEDVHEVWVPSEHIASALRPVAGKPVSSIRLPILPPRVDPAITREALGLPARRIFLFAFDFLRGFARKNPIGLIDAYTRAFSPDDGAALVIKSSNGDERLLDLEHLRAAASARPDIFLIDRILLPDERAALLAHCDCYVSLHRAAGLGLSLGEAMALGKPAIATGYSGNLTFMTPRNSWLVDYALASIPPGCDPYPAGASWADPNLDHAAALMRRVHDDPAAAAALGARAAEELRAAFSLEACAREFAGKVSALRDRSVR